MSYRNLLTATTIVAFLFGLGMIFIPYQLFTLYNVLLDPGGVFVAKLFGATLMAIGVMSWLGRNVHDAIGRQVVITTNLVGNVLGFVISLLGILDGSTGVNNLGWSTVVFYFVFAAAYAFYFYQYSGSVVTDPLRRARN
jgi:hypothetical protein